jgi:hypothetical protein
MAFYRLTTNHHAQLHALGLAQTLDSSAELILCSGDTGMQLKASDEAIALVVLGNLMPVAQTTPIPRRGSR